MQKVYGEVIFFQKHLNLFLYTNASGCILSMENPKVFLYKSGEGRDAGCHEQESSIDFFLWCSPIQLLSKLLSTSRSQIAVFTARALVEWTASIRTISPFKRHPGRQSSRSDRKAPTTKDFCSNFRLNKCITYYHEKIRNAPGPADSRSLCVRCLESLHKRMCVRRRDWSHCSSFSSDTCEENRTHRGRR